jgi:DNA-binding NtrC family response regulator
VKILLLDPDPETTSVLEQSLEGVEVCATGSQADGLRLLGQGGWDAVLLDEEFCGAGLALLSRMTTNGSAPAPVVLLTRCPTMETTLEAIRLGAHDVLAKPLTLVRLREILSAGAASAGRARPISSSAGPDEMIGSSPEMLSVYRVVARAAASDATVLLLGESGTGKEMIARALHTRSRRAGRPFVAINCAAIPDNLLESELFGHEKGAFTGAIGRRIGRFERASGGTLFLDEIADMSLALQAKILRALQEREIERVGGGDPVRFDVRVVAATNQDLASAVAAGTFREDLYYRLAVVTLRLPPVRDRGADLDRLAEHFAGLYACIHHRPARAISEDALGILRNHPWPGNVRQLRNAMERAVVMCEGRVLLPEHLPADVRAPGEPGRSDEPTVPLLSLAEMEQRMIRRALAATGGNHTRAAEILGIHRNTLRRKIAEYGIDVT